MYALHGKPLRKLNRALDIFFGPKALTSPRTIQDFSVPDLLAREIHLDNGQILLMTDVGLEQFNVLAAVLSQAIQFSGDAAESDVRAATLDVLKNCISKRVRPDDGEEFELMVSTALRATIDDTTFAVPLHGVRLVDVTEVALGTFKIVCADTSLLDRLRVRYDQKTVEPAVSGVKFWLLGTVRGTKGVAEERFMAHAELLTGMLAVIAASMYRHGAHAFRIVVAMAVQAHMRSAWLSWTDRQRIASTHMKYLGKQQFEINAELIRQFDEARIIPTACAFFESANRTQLEEAIARAVYWFAEAHREVIPTMKLVKYWSCVETFFSAGGSDITSSVSSGVAAVLVFGGLAVVPKTDYVATRRRVAKLYGARSRALHRGSHTHVSELDAAELSQWVAWMLINMISFQMRGYTRVEQIQHHTKRLDAIMSKAA